MFEFQLHRTAASLEGPLARRSADLFRIASACDRGDAYYVRELMIRGRFRQVAIPDGALNAVHRHINRLLYPIDQSFPRSVHGYVTRRNALSNAQQHLGATFLSKFDIKEFFASVSASLISSKLEELGFGADAANILARLCTNRGRLPLGAQTSPRLSNIVLMHLDQVLERVAAEHGSVYTRYADDLAFSADHPLDLAADVERAVNVAGFALNPRKSRNFKHGQPMFVTGLSVSDGERPRVRARLKAKLRQEFYFVEKFGLEGHADRVGDHKYSVAYRLSGEFHYVRAIEPAFVAKLRALYPAATSSIVPIHHDARIDRTRRHRAEFVDRVHAEEAPRLATYTPHVTMTG